MPYKFRVSPDGAINQVPDNKFDAAIIFSLLAYSSDRL